MSDGKHELRELSSEEVNEIVAAKVRNLNYIQDNIGIWGMPYGSERDSLKYWRDVQAGRLPRPLKGVAC